MEQIDYKKKYEEAIERLKQWDREHRSGYTIQERDEFIFPELRESEDEKNIDFLIHLIEHNVPNHSFAFGDGCAYGYKSKEEAINILKSIRYRIISQPKQSEQKPAEWSEEDKDKLNYLLRILRTINDEKHFSCISWLISLRRRNQWKPSKEQLEALMNQCINTKSTETGAFLCDLYYDLKKL